MRGRVCGRARARAWACAGVRVCAGVRGCARACGGAWRGAWRGACRCASHGGHMAQPDGVALGSHGVTRGHAGSRGVTWGLHGAPRPRRTRRRRPPWGARPSPARA
eukprot:3544109-Prymnesium_polylepis.2